MWLSKRRLRHKQKIIYEELERLNYSQILDNDKTLFGIYVINWYLYD